MTGRRFYVPWWVVVGMPFIVTAAAMMLALLSVGARALIGVCCG